MKEQLKQLVKNLRDELIHYGELLSLLEQQQEKEGGKILVHLL